MMHEYDLVALLVPIPSYNLIAGDTGVIVDMRPDLDAYLVEFIRDEETVAVTSVSARQIRVIEEVDEETATVAD